MHTDLLGQAVGGLGVRTRLSKRPLALQAVTRHTFRRNKPKSAFKNQVSSRRVSRCQAEFMNRSHGEEQFENIVNASARQLQCTIPGWNHQICVVQSELHQAVHSEARRCGTLLSFLHLAPSGTP